MSIEIEPGRHPQHSPRPELHTPLPAEVLRLSRRELARAIREELERNPLLEERSTTLAQDRSDASRLLSSIERFEAEEDGGLPMDDGLTEEVMATEGPDEIDWADYPNHFLLAPASSEELGAELLLASLDSSDESSLFDHLARQVRLDSFSSREEKVALLILENLDESGYFRIEGLDGDPLIAVAAQAQVGLDLAAGTLRKLQQLDPPGVCARDLEECLLIQARAQGEEGGLVGAIIRKHLHALEARSLRSIATDQNVDLDAVIEAERIISEMDPKPGRSFAGGDGPGVLPDVFLQKAGDDYLVSVDDPLARIRISRRYRSALQNGKAEAGGTVDFLRDNLDAATALLSSVHQRRQLLREVTEAIVTTQRAFLEHGPSRIQPLRLGALAAVVGIHEFMVADLVHAKFVATPHGILPLSAFVLRLGRSRSL